MVYINNSEPQSSGFPNYPAIEELKTYRQWVAWKQGERDGRPTKLPINPHTGGLAKTNDANTWGAYEQAVERASKDGLAGVGFVLSKEDNLTGYDFDKCRNPVTGKLKPWAKAILENNE